MYINKFGFFILFIMFFLTSHVEGAIYICIDSKGIKNYSDKKCSINKTVKIEVIGDLGKTAIPKYILEYSPVIQIVKRVLRLIRQQNPNNKRYQRAYNYSLIVEKNHNDYIAFMRKTYPKEYNPFDQAPLNNIIAVISETCRNKAYMTACGIIESNDWLSSKEQIYLKGQLEKGIQVRRTAVEKKLFCEKAKHASNGGVISTISVNYFCGTS
ncbi:MAG: hypothetical protein ACI9IA_002324 [Enterobacterales bacterium]|jgi:hypothetical protein